MDEKLQALHEELVDKYSSLFEEQASRKTILDECSKKIKLLESEIQQIVNEIRDIKNGQGRLNL